MEAGMAGHPSGCSRSSRACFFWPGSEAEIQGARPSYYLKYNEKIPDDLRVSVLAWLRLPAEQRPTLYFSEVDHAGHEHGPDSEEVRTAVQAVDKEIGDLMEGVAKTKLPVDVIVLSDHGMAKVPGGLDYAGQIFSGCQRVRTVYFARFICEI